MSLVVRAVDVGYRQTKFVTGIAGASIRCASFPSVAYPSKRDQTKLAAIERRQTVSVPIGGLFYEVGPDVALAADAFRASQMHDRFTDTPEYLALLRGALRMMNVPVIDLLVVGLPVALLTLRKASLEKAMTGIHDVGGGKRVEVKKAMVMAQPQGALVYYATATNRLAGMKDQPSLVVDPGGRTFDWLVSRGMRLVQKKSHSLNRGVSDVLRAVASEISMEIGTRYMDVDAIDEALRLERPLILHQRPYDLVRLQRVVDKLAEQAVSSMMQWIDDPYSLRHIVLTGGGAWLFKRAVKAAFPKQKIQVLRDPMYANVRGFQIAGMNFTQTQATVDHLPNAKQVGVKS